VLQSIWPYSGSPKKLAITLVEGSCQADQQGSDQGESPTAEQKADQVELPPRASDFA
jgi:hypothetical protein